MCRLAARSKLERDGLSAAEGANLIEPSLVGSESQDIGMKRRIARDSLVEDLDERGILPALHEPIECDPLSPWRTPRSR